MLPRARRGRRSRRDAAQGLGIRSRQRARPHDAGGMRGRGGLVSDADAAREELVMRAYQQKTRAAAKPQTGVDAHGIDARSATTAGGATSDGSASQSPPASAPRSLRQMRQALDDSPRVRQQAALQRALDRGSRTAAPAKKKSLKEKPSLQPKGISINDDAGLEREADVMGNR